MVPWHVTSGMNGAITVLPREGLKDPQGNLITYDRVYYVGEQDFYVPKDADGNYMAFESIGDGYADTITAMRTLTPSHIVFNGKVGALTGDNALRVAAYATEAGQFQRAGFPAVICGPGSVEQAHQPDEFVAVSEMEKGLVMFRRFLETLRA